MEQCKLSGSILSEAPGADPHAGRCGAGGEKPPATRLYAYSISKLYTKFIEKPDDFHINIGNADSFN